MENVYIFYEYTNSSINGIGTYIQELTHSLKELKINICHIICYHDSKTFRIAIKDGIKQMQFPLIPNFCYQHYHIIDKFLRLHIQDSVDNIFFFNYTPSEHLVKTVKASFPLSKLVFTIHDMTWTGAMLGDKTELKKYTTTENQELFEREYPDMFPSFNQEKRMYETVHRIVALAPETAELLQNVYKISKDKISFIPNGFRDECPKLPEKEIKLLKERLLIPKREKVIIFAGRVTNVKGIYQIINSLKKIVKTYPDFRLIVAGTIFNVKAIMDHAGEIAPKITFTGQIPKSRLTEWYQIADIGILASYWEQCSYTGIEMMMYGLPLIASDGFCLGDMFINDINAKVAKIGNRDTPEVFEDNLSKAFLELLQSDELCKELGNNGRKIYESKYQIKYMKKGYQLLFRSLQENIAKQKCLELAISDRCG